MSTTDNPDVQVDSNIDEGDIYDTTERAPVLETDFFREFGLTNAEAAAIIKDYNGDLEFRTDEAQVGYIKPEEYLILPVNIKAGEKSDDYADFVDWQASDGEAGKKEAVNLSLVITALNMPGLGGGSDAVPYAYLRAKLVVKGYLYAFRQNADGGRCVYTDEVRACTFAEYSAVDAPTKKLIKDFYKSEERKFIDKHWRVFAAMLGHVLAVRGHHYRDAKVATDKDVATESYAELYKRLWRASAIEGDLPFKDIKKVFRTAMHPFGLKVFTDILDNGVQENILPRTFIIRSDAIPAGAAKIGTGAAALKMMKAAIWFKRFEETYQEPIDKVFQAERLIKQDRLAYHVSPRLFGMDGPAVSNKRILNDAVDAVSAIAPYIVAYINIECENSPIALQKTLNNPANDQMGLMNRFKRYLETMNRNAQDSSDINEILPRIEEPEDT